ncbi:MAG: AbrB/MazE/SpoVT family DNA-binding domain-containing protein [Candidatus Helarchaeota archaeon]
MSSKGQVVIPKEIREILALKPGTKFNVKLDEKKIIFEPIIDINFKELIVRISDKKVSEFIEETKKLESERERKLLKALGVE